MRFRKEFLVAGIFLAGYIPACFAFWFGDNNFDLLFAILVGVTIVLAYFATTLTIESIKKQRAEITEIMILRDYPETEDNYEGFRRMFSENTSGGKKI